MPDAARDTEAQALEQINRRVLERNRKEPAVEVLVVVGVTGIRGVHTVSDAVDDRQLIRESPAHEVAEELRAVVALRHQVGR